MAGYNPARNIYLDGSVHKLNWFQRWWKTRRDKKANRRRAWMKLLAGTIIPPAERNEFWDWLDAQSTDYILAKSGVDQQYINFCVEQNEQTESAF